MAFAAVDDKPREGFKFFGLELSPRVSMRFRGWVNPPPGHGYDKGLLDYCRYIKALLTPY